jgi:F-type H+-transporting ATPase subunit epsilon
MRLRVATPDNVKFDDDVEMVIMRCITGDMGILANHEATSTILDYGILRILDSGVERRMAVYGGIAQVRDNSVTILANDAQWPEDIDIAFVESEKERMARRAQENLDALEIQRDAILMRRTLVQIEVSAYPIIGKIERDEEKTANNVK